MQDVTEDAAAPPIVTPLPVLVPDGADASVRELAFAAQQYAQVRTVPVVPEPYIAVCTFWRARSVSLKY